MVISGPNARAFNAGQVVARNPAPLPAKGSPDTLFRVVGGLVVLRGLVGVVTEAVGAVSKKTERLELAVTLEGAKGKMPLLDKVDVLGVEVGAMVPAVLDGVPGAVAVPLPVSGVVVRPCDVVLSCSAMPTGGMRWLAVSYPLDDGAYIQKVWKKG